jgi:hypothetical protein
MKPKVFISHTDRVPEDKAFTDLIVRKFREAGIPYWIDREHPLQAKTKEGAVGPSPENPLFHHLCDAIASCDVLLFVVSRKSVSREFVRLEFDPRVLYGPAAQIMENETAVMALLNNPGAVEITTVLAILCGENNVIDVEGKLFDSFWEHFEQIYSRAQVLPKHDSWREQSKFMRRPPSQKPGKLERREFAKEGEELFQRALERVAEGIFDHAEELLADAYQAFRKACDPLAIGHVLYQTFKVHLHLGLEILLRDREIYELSDMVIRDSYVLGLQDIAYALDCLKGSVEHFAKAGDIKLASEMARQLSQTEEALKDAGIQNAQEMCASAQREQVRTVLEILAKPLSDSEQ